jgi:DNA-binding response OmpR family regulator
MGGRDLVLLVDDEELVRKVIARALEAHGYAVVPCADRASAAAALNRANGNLRAAVLDWSIQGTPADDLVRRLRETHPSVPLVILSGYPEDLVAQGLRGFTDYTFVAKPFHIGGLLQAISRNGSAEGGTPTGSSSEDGQSPSPAD